MCGHDGADDYFMGEIFLQLLGAFDPVPCSLFGDEFDVGEGGFFSQGIGGSLEDPGGDVDDLIFIEDEGFGDDKAPAHLEGSSDHGVGGGGWS